jgi:hypothetical protein
VSEVVGPFGNPDGSRADLDDVVGEFVDFGGHPAFGDLATPAADSTVRVIVGTLGAGKTVYMRRLQDYQSHQDSVYATAPQQDLPETEVVVRACQWFTGQVLVEKWMQIWRRAILRALASHLLLRRELRRLVPDDLAEELSTEYGRLLGDYRRPRSVYSQVRDIINDQHTAHQLTSYLTDSAWDDLEDALGEALAQCKPVYFYLDAVDEEFGHAPMYWLKCQEGLFYQVMRLLRDHRFGGRLHVVVAVRDIVISSVYRSEHAPRYRNEPHIRVLHWDKAALLYLLQRKLRRLPPQQLMRPVHGDDVTVRDWLGLPSVTNEWGAREKIEDYLVRHTRMIPRDVVTLGNALAGEVSRAKQAGRDKVPEQAVHDVVARCAKWFGDSQLAQCANQVASDLMPAQAAQHGYSDLYTGAGAYISGSVLDQMRSILRLMSTSRFPRRDLEVLRAIGNPQFDDATDLTSVLWLNGLLGYVDPEGRERFYSLGDVEDFQVPAEVDDYVVHPVLARSLGLSAGNGGTVRPEAGRQTSGGPA